MMINYQIAIVVVTIILMVFLLVRDYLRPGLILFGAVVIFLAAGILTPSEALAGFSNKGMITVALLFLISEAVRRSDCLGPITNRIFPWSNNCSVKRGYISILPIVATISAFMNNTPVVVIFIPQIKAWCKKVGLPLKKFLIPLSYAAILGGMCTLIGTSTNLVVHGLMIDAGLEGLSMFEIGKVGLIVLVASLIYLILFASKLLPNDMATVREENHIVEVVLAARFPGIRCSIKDFDFKRHYGARIVAVRRDGEELDDLDNYYYKENDTLILATKDGSFVDTWGESRVFLIVTNGRNHETEVVRWKRILSLVLLVVMVIGATACETPFARGILGDNTPDMFFWAAVVTIIMAACNIFPAKKYTKFISWDILITIASALAISRAMINSGLASALASMLISLSKDVSPHIVLAAIYITTNIITEIITNNAAAAFAFPVGLSAATQLGVSPTPFCIAICIAASASFSSPIGYQTNMIVQGLGGYKFRDFVLTGLPLNIIAFVVSMIFIPIFWSF